jgi:hypothetical protein
VASKDALDTDRSPDFKITVIREMCASFSRLFEKDVQKPSGVHPSKSFNGLEPSKSSPTTLDISLALLLTEELSIIDTAHLIGGSGPLTNECLLLSFAR